MCVYLGNVCYRVVLITDGAKRNVSRPLIQDEPPKVVMVSSSEKDIVQTGPSAVDSGLGLYTPATSQGSGTDLRKQKANQKWYDDKNFPKKLPILITKHGFISNCTISTFFIIVYIYSTYMYNARIYLVSSTMLLIFMCTNFINNLLSLIFCYYSSTNSNNKQIVMLVKIC